MDSLQIPSNLFLFCSSQGCVWHHQSNLSKNYCIELSILNLPETDLQRGPSVPHNN